MAAASSASPSKARRRAWNTGTKVFIASSVAPGYAAMMRANNSLTSMLGLVCLDYLKPLADAALVVCLTRPELRGDPRHRIDRPLPLGLLHGSQNRIIPVFLEPFADDSSARSIIQTTAPHQPWQAFTENHLACRRLGARTVRYGIIYLWF